MRRSSVAAVVVVAVVGAAALGVAHFARDGSGVKKSLVFEKESARGSSIWRSNPDGTDPVRLASGTDPQISPDGSLVAYLGKKEARRVLLHGGRDSKTNGLRTIRSVAVYVIPVGGGATKLVAKVNPSGMSLAWAADSQHLALGSNGRFRVANLRSGK